MRCNTSSTSPVAASGPTSAAHKLIHPTVCAADAIGCSPAGKTKRKRLRRCSIPLLTVPSGTRVYGQAVRSPGTLRCAGTDLGPDSSAARRHQKAGGPPTPITESRSNMTDNCRVSKFVAKSHFKWRTLANPPRACDESTERAGRDDVGHQWSGYVGGTVMPLRVSRSRRRFEQSQARPQCPPICLIFSDALDYPSFVCHYRDVPDAQKGMRLLRGTLLRYADGGRESAS